MKTNLTSKLLKNFIIAGIVLTIIPLIATPLILTATTKLNIIESSSNNVVLFLTICIYICAVPYIASLFKLKSIATLLTNKNEFSPKISEHFKFIGICAFSEAFLFLGSVVFLYFSIDFYMYAFTIIPSIVVPFVSIVLGLLSLIMSNIFKQASKIKEEIDLTF